MALTAQDVHDRQFRMVRQSTGYDIEEVDGFLEEVEAELRRLQAELAEARGGAGASEGRSAGEAAAATDDGGADTASGDGAGRPGAAAAGGGLDPTDPRARATRPEAPATAAARILEMAQRTADDYLADAQRHAERIRGEAAGMENRVSELRVYESELRGRLRSYFHTEFEQLKAVLGDD